jgi:hypothetical protein
MEEESANSKNKDNFLFENLPGAEDMLIKTLPNKDLLYYPYNFQQNNQKLNLNYMKLIILEFYCEIF